MKCRIPITHPEGASEVLASLDNVACHIQGDRLCGARCAHRRRCCSWGRRFGRLGRLGCQSLARGRSRFRRPVRLGGRTHKAHEAGTRSPESPRSLRPDRALCRNECVPLRGLQAWWRFKPATHRARSRSRCETGLKCLQRAAAPQARRGRLAGSGRLKAALPKSPLLALGVVIDSANEPHSCWARNGGLRLSVGYASCRQDVPGCPAPATSAESHLCAHRREQTQPPVQASSARRLGARPQIGSPAMSMQV